MSDDDNWDDELGLPAASPPRKLSLLGAQDKRANSLFRMDSADGEEDWSNDFQPQKILGIKADPNAKEEDWGDDFDFNENEEKPISVPRGGLLSRTRSTIHIERGGAYHSLEEILLAIPPPKDIAANPKALTTKHAEAVATTIDRRESVGDTGYWDQLIRQRDEKVTKAPRDTVTQSRAYWELGRLYQTHNKLVNAMTEFQRALQLLEDERVATAANAVASSSSPAGPPSHQHYELELLFQLGLTAKEMSNIFLEIDYLEKAIIIAQTDRKFLPQLTQISLELSRAHVVTDNPQVAMRNVETYLRCLIFGYNTGQSTHAPLDITKIDWGSVAVGCYQLGEMLGVLSQAKGAPQQEVDDYSELSVEFLSKAEGLATVVGDKDTQTKSHNLLERTSSMPGRRTSDAQANASVKDKLEASPKKAESEEEEEDWDLELGISSEQEDRPALAHLLVSTSKPKADKIALKHRLFEAVSSQTFEIVKFPKPTYLYSLTYKGHSFMHEEVLEAWLKNVLASHTKGETVNIAQHAREKLPFAELLSHYSTRIAKVQKGSKEWAALCVEFCYVIYLNSNNEFCLHSIHGFFDDLKNAVGSTRNQHLISESEREILFEHSFHLLYLASKLWKPEEDETFQRMMKAQRQLSQQHAFLVDVLAAETYAHHIHSKTSASQEDEDEDDDDDEDEGELSDGPEDNVPAWSPQKPAQTANGAEQEGFDEAKNNPLLALCKLYAKCKRLRASPTAKPEEKQRALVAMARALIAIHLHMHGISPLTTTRLSTKENVHAVVAKSIGETDKDYAEALQQSSRMRIVEDLYKSLPTGSFLQAKAAYALAHHHKEFLSKTPQAERLFFEAVYILDQCTTFPVGLPPILSELGKNALLGYGDVLTTNYKYQYGILCYEAAISNLQLRGKDSTREHSSLLRRAAAISRDNHDVRRAVLLYREILSSYCNENKINEAVFVAETLASINLERGDFVLAERYLNAASSTLRPQTDRMDPMWFDLQLKQMAPLYLDSFHFEKGIELLDKLKNAEVSHEKRNRLLADLARAYIKKGWFAECTQILAQLEAEEKHAVVNADIAKIGASSKHPLPSSTKMSPVGSAGKLPTKQTLPVQSPPPLPTSASFPSAYGAAVNLPSFTGGMGAGSAGSSRYFELLTLNNFRAGRCQEAISAIELAIDLCPVSSLFSRGHYFYLRGKVLQSLCSSSSTINIRFPTALKLPVYEQPTTGDTTTYNCMGDVVQEAAASYKKAYPIK